MRASLDKVLELRVTRSPNNVRCALPPKASTGGITFTQHGGQRSHLAMNTVTARPPPALQAAASSQPALLRHYADSACDTLTIAFAGYGGGGVARHEFVGACSKAEASHALFVKDAHNSWYLHGLGESQEASETSFDAVVQAVADDVAGLKPKRVVLLGASMGGYAAVRAGLALRVARPEVAEFRILAFGPQVFIDPEERALLGLPAGSWETELRRLKGVCARRAVVMASALDALLAPEVHDEATPPPVEITLYVGALAKSDVIEARLLEEAASTSSSCSVTVHVQEEVGHNNVRLLRESGALDELLRERLGQRDLVAEVS